MFNKLQHFWFFNLACFWLIDSWEDGQKTVFRDLLIWFDLTKERIDEFSGFSHWETAGSADVKFLPDVFYDNPDRLFRTCLELDRRFFKSLITIKSFRLHRVLRSQFQWRLEWAMGNCIKIMFYLLQLDFCFFLLFKHSLEFLLQRFFNFVSPAINKSLHEDDVGKHDWT